MKCHICGNDHGVKPESVRIVNSLETHAEAVRWANTCAHSDAEHRKLVASGALKPENNKHLYEHLRGVKGYEGFCNRIFGDPLSCPTL